MLLLQELFGFSPPRQQTALDEFIGDLPRIFETESLLLHLFAGFLEELRLDQAALLDQSQEGFGSQFGRRCHIRFEVRRRDVLRNANGLSSEWTDSSG